MKTPWKKPENEMTKVQSTEIAIITPMQLIQEAIAKDADVEKMAQLMDLQERYDNKQARMAYVSAMAEFKKNPPKLVKSTHVSFTTSKGTTEYKHASLDQVVNTVSPALSKHGLSHRWDTEQGEQGIIKVTCIITHVEGHSEKTWLQSSPDASGGKNSIQAIGSAVTYLQRYTLLTALGLATEAQDDDGVASSGVITDEQFVEIDAMLDETGSDKKRFCERFKIESVNQLPAQEFKTALNMINAKKGKTQ